MDKVIIIGLGLIGIGLFLAGDVMGFSKGMDTICKETQWQSPTCITIKNDKLKAVGLQPEPDRGQDDN